MKNLYLETARPQISAPALAGDSQADVVIVGGGYSGLSTALHLAEQGAKAVVLEAGDIGHGCSGRNGGQINPGLKLLPDAVEAHFGTERGQRMNRLASEAPAFVFDLVARHGIDCAAVNSGTIRAAIDRAGLQQVHDLVAQATARGWPIRFADRAEMAAMTGCGIYLGGAVDARGGHLNPLGYARGLGLAAQKAGAVLHGQSAALSLRRTGAGWRVETAAGSVTAPELLICTNGYTGDLWPGMRQALVPIYTYIAATDPLPEALRAQIMPCGAALYEAAWDVIYYRIDDAGRLLMGGRGAQRDARGPADYRHLVDYAVKLWPALKGVDFPWTWHGQVAVTPDHFPHLVRPAEGVRLLFGYNGRGVALSSIAGKLTADHILSGGKVDISLPVEDKLTRFAFHPFWRIGAETTMAWHGMLDRLSGR